MKPTTLLTRNGSNDARHAVGARLERELVDAVMRRRRGAPLPGLEVHRLVAHPGDVAAAVMPSTAARGLREEREVDSEARVGRLGAGDRLEDQIDRSALADQIERRGHVREHAGLRRNVELDLISSSIDNSACAFSGLSVAGLIPITASPAPRSRPSRMLAAMARIVGRMIGSQPHARSPPANLPWCGTPPARPRIPPP